jgi:hypothetical protein
MLKLNPFGFAAQLNLLFSRGCDRACSASAALSLGYY